MYPYYGFNWRGRRWISNCKRVPEVADRHVYAWQVCTDALPVEYLAESRDSEVLWGWYEKTRK